MPDDEVPEVDALADALFRVGEGDRAAFARLYRLTSPTLFSVCLRILPRIEAEEALQEIYLSVWRGASRFDAARGRAMTWLVTLARNGAVDRLRASRPVATAPIEEVNQIADPAPLVAERLVSDGESRRLAYCFETLDALDARFIRTAFLEGSTYPELAERASLPLGTVKSRIRRALLKLRDCLG